MSPRVAPRGARGIGELSVGELRAVLTGWTGDEGVTVTEALELMAAADERAEKDAERDRRLQADADAWLAAREQAGKRAYRDAHERVTRTGRGDPQARAEAREASRQAVLRFEQEHALPDGLPSALLSSET